MEDEVTNLLYALERVIDSTNEHDREYAKYDGYSWGYHGSGLIHARDKARSDFTTRLLGVIDARVAAALSKEDAA